MKVEIILMVYRILWTIVIGFLCIAFVWTVTKFLGNFVDESILKMIKVVLYAFITFYTLYYMIWMEDEDTMLNFCIFLISFYESYSNADEIIFVFTSKLYHFTMDGVDYKVRVKKKRN